LICSCKVIVILFIVLVSLEILSVNEPFDSLLDHERVWYELGLEVPGGLQEERRMVETLSGLHDSHNGCIDDQLSVVINLFGDLISLCRLLLFRAEHRQFDLETVVLVGEVNLEEIFILELAFLWELVKDLELAERD
jgi:hypothetical protein